MKFSALALSALYLVKAENKHDVSSESGEFWRRFLASSSLSLEPTPSPVSPVPCKVAVSLECTEKQSGKSCNEILAPTDETCASSSSLETICYDIKIDNVGEAPMDITKLVFILNNERDDILEKLDSTLVPIGEEKQYEICKEVDLCTKRFVAKAVVAAKPPTGDSCKALTEYDFTVVTPPPQPVPAPQPVPVPVPQPVPVPVPQPLPVPVPVPVPEPAPVPVPVPEPAPVPVPVPEPAPVPVPVPVPQPLPVPVVVPTPVAPPLPVCKTEITLDCKTAEGLACEDFPSPDTVCTNDVGFLDLEFRFTDNTCSNSSNTQGNLAFCADFAPITEPAQIECVSDLGTPLEVSPPIIRFGDFFKVSNPNGGELPPQTDCTVINANDVKVQQNVIDTSGNVPTNLGDRFGSFELVACGEQKCIETVTYDIEVSNAGSSVINITSVDFTFQTDTERLIQNSPLAPGATTTFAPKREVNLCSGDEYTASVITKTSSDAGICQADDEYKFQITP